MSPYQEISGEIHESWHEMQETLHEAYEMQEQEAALSGEFSGTRIVTPAVIIRITLAPVRQGSQAAIFRSPRAIVGAATTPTVQSPAYGGRVVTGRQRDPATGQFVRRRVIQSGPAIVQKAPLSGRPYVPIRQRDPATGRFVSSGMVYVPKKGSNVVQAALWTKRGVSPVKQAGVWLRNQIAQTPAIRRRLRRVQVLVDGKPCKHCVSQLASNMRGTMPTGTKLRVRFSPTIRVVSPSTGTIARRRVATTVSTAGQKPGIATRRPVTAKAGAGLKPRTGASVSRVSPQQAVRRKAGTPAVSAPRATGTAAKTGATAPQKMRPATTPAAGRQRPTSAASVPKPTAMAAPRSVLGKVMREAGI